MLLKFLQNSQENRSLWHRCFPVNFAKFSRTPFLKKTSGGCFCFGWPFYLQITRDWCKYNSFCNTTFCLSKDSTSFAFKLIKFTLLPFSSWSWLKLVFLRKKDPDHKPNLTLTLVPYGFFFSDFFFLTPKLICFFVTYL